MRDEVVGHEAKQNAAHAAEGLRGGRREGGVARWRVCFCDGVSGVAC